MLEIRNLLVTRQIYLVSLYTITTLGFSLLFTMNTSLSLRVRIIQIFRIAKDQLFFMQDNLHHYTIYFECSKRRMIFQRKFVQRRKYIFGSGMRERFVFLFFPPFLFFSFITWKHLRFWTMRDICTNLRKVAAIWYPTDTEMSHLLSTSTTLKPYLVPTERDIHISTSPSD